VKYNPKSLFITYLSNSRTGQTGRRIFTLDASNDAVSHKGMLFWFWLILQPI